MQVRQRETRQAELSDSESSVEEDGGGGGGVYNNTRSRDKARSKKGRRHEVDLDYQPRAPIRQKPKRQATSTLKLSTATKKQQCNNNDNAIVARPVLHIKRRSIYDMNIVEINDALKQHLKGQDESMDRLTDILFRFNQRPLPGASGGGVPASKKCILPLMLSGVSGTGKTTTAKLLKQLYDIGDAQYIKKDLTVMTDETQVNILLGSGPGLVGSTSRATLPMDLLRAIGRAPTGKMDVDLTEEQYQQRMMQYQQRQPNNDIEPPPSPPRTILLHFEETDKAYHKFLTLMLNFIEDGELTASNSEIKFVLPDETRLIVVFSANFASRYIKTLCPLTQYAEARESISLAIEEYGVPRAVLGRLPYLLPFFALDQETTRQISHDMVAKVLNDREHPYRAQFSHIGYGKNVIDIIASIYAIGCSNETTDNADLGMRGLEAGLETFKTEVYYGIASCLLRHHALQQQQQPILTPSQQQYDIDDDDDDPHVPFRRVTRSISQSNQKKSSPPQKQQPSPPPPSPSTVTPHLSYRVFDDYPDNGELATLIRDSPHAFSRSAQSQIEARLKQAVAVGLLMVHLGEHLLLCIVNRALPCPVREQPQRPRLTFSYNNGGGGGGGGAPRLTLVGVPPRRVLLASRQIIRCPQCHTSHGKNEPCDDILDYGDYDNSANMMEFAFHTLKQQSHRYRYPLLSTSSHATA